MKALVFRHNLSREAAATIGGRVDRRAYVSRLAPVRIEDIAEPPLPGHDWVRVETTCSGLCGSDVKQIVLNGRRDNPLTALVSFPHVLGHEAVGRRADTGQRVVLNPWLSCGPRGIDPPCHGMPGRPLPLVPQLSRGQPARLYPHRELRGSRWRARRAVRSPPLAAVPDS